MTQEQYYFGQGKVSSRQRNATGAAAKWRWWGDVSELSLAAESEAINHRESYSGTRGVVRNIVMPTGMTLTGTIRQLDPTSLAAEIYGTASTTEAGTVTAEVIPTVVVGDTIKLNHPGVSALIITDSTTGTAVTLAAENYRLDADFGSLEILTLPVGATQPFKAAYSYAGTRQVNFLTAPQPEIEFRYEGINLAEGNAPQILEIYKASTGLLKALALIQTGTEVAGREFTASVLLDSSKPAGGELGQYGRLIQIDRE